VSERVAAMPSSRLLLLPRDPPCVHAPTSLKSSRARPLPLPWLRLAPPRANATTATMADRAHYRPALPHRCCLVCHGRARLDFPPVAPDQAAGSKACRSASDLSSSPSVPWTHEAKAPRATTCQAVLATSFAAPYCTQSNSALVPLPR
jgi:hypothetical protein